MSLDKIQSPWFASQLGFSSICAILWVISGFTGLKKHDGCWCSRTKRECPKSLKAALSPLFIESVFNFEFYCLQPWTETVQSKHNRHHFVFTIWQVRSSPETECFFSSSAILKPALLHTTNRKATNSSGCLPGPHPVLSPCSDHAHEHQELDCCFSIKQHVQQILHQANHVWLKGILHLELKIKSMWTGEKKRKPHSGYKLVRQRHESVKTACNREQIIDWGNAINEHYRPQKSLNQISALSQFSPRNLFLAQARACDLLVQKAENARTCANKKK